MAIRRDLPRPRTCTPNYWPGNANPKKVYVAYNGPREGVHAHFSSIEKSKELQYQGIEPWKVMNVWQSRCLMYHPDCRQNPRQPSNPWSLIDFNSDVASSQANDRSLAEAFARGLSIEDEAQPLAEQDAISTARQLGGSYRTAPSSLPTTSEPQWDSGPSAARRTAGADGDLEASSDSEDVVEDERLSPPLLTSSVNITIQSNCSRISRGPQPVRRTQLTHPSPARSSQPIRTHHDQHSRRAAGTSASAAQPSRASGAPSSVPSSISEAGPSARSRSLSPRKPRAAAFLVILAGDRPSVITADEQRALELMRSLADEGARPRLQRTTSWDRALALVPGLDEAGEVFFVLEQDGTGPCAVMDKVQAQQDMRRQAASGTRPALHVASSFEDMMSLMDDLV
ncbi:hypothetical protein EV122DRAFT_284570 [Schizophyllum commune]